jgi:hypothetical protein
MTTTVQGVKQTIEHFTGPGVSHYLGFKSRKDDKGSLTSGEGRVFMLDNVRHPETGEFLKRKDGIETFEADLKPLLERQYSNGVTGMVALQVLSEVADLMRSGEVENIHGEPDKELPE